MARPIAVEADVARRAAHWHWDLRVRVQVRRARSQHCVAIDRSIFGGQFGNLLTIDERTLFAAGTFRALASTVIVSDRTLEAAVSQLMARSCRPSSTSRAIQENDANSRHL